MSSDMKIFIKIRPKPLKKEPYNWSPRNLSKKLDSLVDRQQTDYNLEHLVLSLSAR